MGTTHGDIEPDYAIAPGETLLELLDERSMSQADLAERSGLSAKHINQIIHGVVAITPDTALLLERVTEVPAGFWNRLESHYQEQRSRLEEASRLASEAAWAKQFPLREMRARKLIRSKDPVEQLRELLTFFGVASPKTWEGMWSPTAFRRSTKHEGDRFAIAAWIREGERAADSIDCAHYDEKSFRNALLEVRSLTRITDATEWFPRLQQLCADAGVAVVATPEYKGTRLCGATRWLSPNKALIGLSLRYAWADIFWFTFFHEAAHILLHSKKSTYVDWPDGRDDPSSEQEADEFASKWLIPLKYEGMLREIKTLSEAAEFAEMIGLSAGSVVGRLQHDGQLQYNVGNGLRTRLAWK